VRGISPEALSVLEAYHWPGNVRELENVIERAIVLGSREMITPDALPSNLVRPPELPENAPELPDEGFDLEATLDRLERRYLQQALKRTGGNQTRAATLLGLSFRQLRYKVRKHALHPDLEAPGRARTGPALQE
jgi:DNA-binding NtrC family response regulator